MLVPGQQLRFARPVVSVLPECHPRSTRFAFVRMRGRLDLGSARLGLPVAMAGTLAVGSPSRAAAPPRGMRAVRAGRMQTPKNGTRSRSRRDDRRCA